MKMKSNKVVISILALFVLFIFSTFLGTLEPYESQNNLEVVQGLNEVRNKVVDSHPRKEVNPSLHHALLVVNSAKTIVDFLYHTYEYERNLGRLETIN